MTLSPLEWMQAKNGAITEDLLIISQDVLNLPIYFYSVPKSSWTSWFFFFFLLLFLFFFNIMISKGGKKKRLVWHLRMKNIKILLATGKKLEVTSFQRPCYSMGYGNIYQGHNYPVTTSQGIVVQELGQSSENSWNGYIQHPQNTHIDNNKSAAEKPCSRNVWDPVLMCKTCNTHPHLFPCTVTRRVDIHFKSLCSVSVNCIHSYLSALIWQFNAHV